MQHCSQNSTSLEDNCDVGYHSLTLSLTLHPGKACLWDVPAEHVEDLHVSRQASPQAEPVQCRFDAVMSLLPMVSWNGGGLDIVPMSIYLHPSFDDLSLSLCTG